MELTSPPTAEGTIREGRYLLFDSSCSECTEISGLVEQEAGDWLSARSLHDPDIQQVLSNTYPDWKWEPTLLEIKQGKARVFTGIAMKMRMVRGLGPQRAVRVARISRRSNAYEGELRQTPSDSTIELRPIGRRKALKAFAAFGLAASIPSTLFSSQAFAKTAPQDDPFKFTVSKFNGLRAQKAVQSARRNKDASLLWDYLTREGFAPELNHAGGAVITPLNTPPNVRFTGKKLRAVQVPFSLKKKQRPVFFFSEIGNEVDTSAAIYRTTADGSVDPEIEILQVAGGRVKSTTVTAPHTPSNSSTALPQSQINTRAVVSCSLCRRIQRTIFNLGCGVATGTICAVGCVFTGPGVGVCEILLCPIVVGLFCTFGAPRPGGSCRRFC